MTVARHPAQASAARYPIRMWCGIVNLLGESRGLDELAREQGCCGLCDLLNAADVVPRLGGGVFNGLMTDFIYPRGIHSFAFRWSSLFLIVPGAAVGA